MNGRIDEFALQINGIAALAYLLMALGNTEIDNVFDPAYPTVSRDFHWIRYAHWAIVGPLTIAILTVVAGVHWVEGLYVSFLVLFGVASGFAGALHTGRYATWPIFAFAVVAYALAGYSLLVRYRRAAYQLHNEIGKLYDLVGQGSFVLYTGYLIVWACAEGGHVADVDQEIIVYTVLDILSKVVFGYVLLLSRESIARYGKFLGNVSHEFEFTFGRAPVYTPVHSTHAPVVTVPYNTTVHIPEGNIPATAALQLTLQADPTVKAVLKPTSA